MQRSGEEVAGRSEDDDGQQPRPGKAGWEPVDRGSARAEGNSAHAQGSPHRQGSGVPIRCLDISLLCLVPRVINYMFMILFMFMYA